MRSALAATGPREPYHRKHKDSGRGKAHIAGFRWEVCMRTMSVVCLAVLGALSNTPVLAGTLPYYEVTANGTWDCRDPSGTFTTTIVVAEETYALLKADGRLGGYGKLKILSFDTHLPNFALLSGPLKDEFKASGGGIAGPRDNYEDISGELFLTVTMSGDRADAWYCTGRHAPDGLI